MEKLMVGKCHIKLWFVIFASFALWFILFYFDSSSLPNRKNRYIHSLLSPYWTPLLVPENNTQLNSGKPLMGSGLEPAVSQLDVSGNGSEYNNHVNIRLPDDNADSATNTIDNGSLADSNSCSGRYIHMYDLPIRFNDDVIKDCRSLNVWYDMCRPLTNRGLGPQLINSNKVFSDKGWYETDQFMLEIIFHERMKRYECLTNDSSLASAHYVPFYAGFDVSRYLWGFNTSIRDATPLALINWLRERSEWKVLGGRDHFLVAGRTTWEFRRLTEEDSDWGNRLMVLPEGKNMTMLVIESSPWHRNDFAIPYPTYFHPSTDDEVFQWQNRIRRLRRRYLFSFAGAPRPNISGSVRGQIIEQCQASNKCRLLDCSTKTNCQNPSNVMKLFQASAFCLQPPGDSYTRRSAFDSMLAGCIPVFFHPGSAYVQYLWHLPKNYTNYSVFISEDDVKAGNVSIEEKLRRIPKEEVKGMREQVIQLIPGLIYANPSSTLETVEDAFDLAVRGVIDRVNRIRKEIKDGVNSGLSYDEMDSWKYNLFGTVEKHEWDSFFYKWKHTKS